jgi:hypothetical protein
MEMGMSMNDDFLLENTKARTKISRGKTRREMVAGEKNRIIRIVDVSVNYGASISGHGDKRSGSGERGSFEPRSSEESK